MVIVARRKFFKTSMSSKQTNTSSTHYETMCAAKYLCYVFIQSSILLLMQSTCDAFKGLYATVHDIDDNTENITVQSTSKDLKHAIKIHIQDAIIPNLCQYGVKNMLQLRILEIFYSDIRTTEAKAFKNLRSLRRLSMNFNRMKTIVKKTFKNLPIHILELNDNDIKTIEERAFENMPNLQVLSLRSNNLADVKKDWFKNVPHLRVFDLSWNEIRKISEDAFLNIAGIESVDIYLSYNNIQSVHPKAFSGFAKLGKLWLNGNQLSEIDGTVFGNLKIVHLNLSENNIVCLAEDFLGSLNTQILAVYSNQFTCECLDHLRRWNTNTFVDVEHFNDC